MSDETFVHGDIEVKKTGRTASKPMPGGKQFLVVEITPVSEYDGTWKKWVRPDVLFHINPVKEK
jgi:hypothetical protein